jgi:hypothetical protein
MNMAAASSAHLFGLGDAQMQMQPPPQQHQQAAAPPPPNPAAPAPKKKRNQPGNPSKYPGFFVIWISCNSSVHRHFF